MYTVFGPNLFLPIYFNSVVQSRNVFIFFSNKPKEFFNIKTGPGTIYNVWIINSMAAVLLLLFVFDINVMTYFFFHLFIAAIGVYMYIYIHIVIIIIGRAYIYMYTVYLLIN